MMSRIRPLLFFLAYSRTGTPLVMPHPRSHLNSRSGKNLGRRSFPQSPSYMCTSVHLFGGNLRQSSSIVRSKCCSDRTYKKSRRLWGILNATIIVLSFLSARAKPANAVAVFHQSSKEMLWMNIEAVFRIIVASLLGSILGLERSPADKKQTGAGSRTMALVSLGACVFTICGTQGFTLAIAREAAKGPDALPGIAYASVDTSRMASTITTGVGFLGAGVISNTRMPDGRFDPESSKRGLATAALIWIASAVGSAIGAGLYYCGLTFVLCSVLILKLSEWLEDETGDSTASRQNEKALAPPKYVGDNPIEFVETKSLAVKQIEEIGVDSGQNKRNTGSENTISWSENLSDDNIVAGKLKREQRIGVVAAAKQSDTSEASPSPVPGAKKAAKKVDQYVDQFLKKKELSTAGDDENESQQIIW